MSSPLKSLILSSLFLIILSQPQICFDYCAQNGCNCYKVFGVGTNTPLNEIKQIYRALSFQYHPDVNPGKDTSAKFAEIASCYEILRDTRARAQYNDCMKYEQSRYVPKSNHDSLWSLAIPIISILVNAFRRQGRQAAQPEQAGQAGSTWKKILKGFCYVIIAVIVFLVLLFQAPFVLDPFIAAFQYVFYGIFGGNAFYFILVGIWSFGLIKKAIQKIRSFLNKSSIEVEIKNSFTDLRKVIDTNQEKLVQEANDKRKAKEDEINLGKNQELEILKRYHNENVDFVDGKPENNEANDEDKALLKSEKEAELEKIYNRNVQLCESRHNEKLKEMNEEFNGLIEKHAKAFESYRDFVSKFEKDIEIK